MRAARRGTADRVAAWRRATVLLVCLGLAAASMAAAGGRPARDPAGSVVAAARKHLSDSYTWGAVGPTTWDCSGLTSTLWREVGGVTAIPRTSRQQQAWAVPLPAEQVLPGDLVFFGEPVTHVGIVASRTTTSAGTTVRMLDASASRGGVVERKVWTTGTVRFGRVPRRGMVRVRPWTPPTVPLVVPTPVVTVPVAPIPRGTVVLPGLPADSLPGSAVGALAARRVRSYLGNRALSDINLVRNAWHYAGGVVLPGSRAGISAQGTPVAIKDARIGDLVFYGPPTSHVGIYVGNGYLVDASRSLGRVVLRRVWASRTVHLLRLTR